MDNLPVYRQIYKEIEDGILSGRFKPGDRIPTEAEWAEQYGVSRITSQKAMDLAVENQLITKMPGRGSFVNESARKNCSRKESQRKVIAIIQPDNSEFFGLDIFITISKLTQEAGMLLVTGLSWNDIEIEKKLIQQFTEYGVDGFIIFPVHNEIFNMEILKLIMNRFPVVLIDRYLKDIACPNVISKNYDAAFRGMNYLYSTGHRKIGIISRPIGSTSTLQEREKGIINAAVESGFKLQQDWWFTGLDNLYIKNDIDVFMKQKDDVKDFLMKNPDLTCIFGLEYAAIKYIEAAAQELELRIPEDLSIICFDSPGQLINYLKPVTHLKQNEVEIASRAFSLLQKMFAGDEFDYRQEIDVDLVMGSTVVPPKP